MPDWKITYVTESGYEGEEIVPAVNKFMAWETFKEISKEYDSKVVSADCVRILED